MTLESQVFRMPDWRRVQASPEHEAVLQFKWEVERTEDDVRRVTREILVSLNSEDGNSDQECRRGMAPALYTR